MPPTPPPDDAEAVDHRRVRIGPDQRVRVDERVPAVRVAADDAREVLDVDLVHDAGVGRHDLEVAEGVLPPLEERVALAVARELEPGVQLERVRGPEVIDLHGMVDHQLGRLERVDPTGVAAEARHAVAHRREVDHRGNAGEVLQQHARGHERDLLADAGRPARERLDVGGGDGTAVLPPQHVLQEDLERVGQAPDARVPGRLERPQAVQVHVAALSIGQRLAGSEGVRAHVG